MIIISFYYGFFSKVTLLLFLLCNPLINEWVGPVTSFVLVLQILHWVFLAPKLCPGLASYPYNMVVFKSKAKRIKPLFQSISKRFTINYQLSSFNHPLLDYYHFQKSEKMVHLVLSILKSEDSSGWIVLESKRANCFPKLWWVMSRTHFFFFLITLLSGYYVVIRIIYEPFNYFYCVLYWICR